MAINSLMRDLYGADRWNLRVPSLVNIPSTPCVTTAVQSPQGKPEAKTLRLGVGSVATGWSDGVTVSTVYGRGLHINSYPHTRFRVDVYPLRGRSLIEAGGQAPDGSEHSRMPK
jgi:hypothetical protein